MRKNKKSSKRKETPSPEIHEIDEIAEFPIITSAEAVQLWTKLHEKVHQLHYGKTEIEAMEIQLYKALTRILYQFSSRYGEECRSDEVSPPLVPPPL